MHVHLIHLGLTEIVDLARGAYVGLFKDVALAIVTYKSPLPQVKLAMAEQQRPLDILLHNELLALNFLCN
jgi:hypothetical protein